MESGIATAWRSDLLAGLLLLQVAMICAGHSIVVKLDYERFRGEPTNGTAAGSWAPPPCFPGVGSDLVCTDSEFPSQDAYCEFRHHSADDTLTTFHVNTTHHTEEGVECRTLLENVRYREGLNATGGVTLAQTDTLCYSTKGERLHYRALQTVSTSLLFSNVASVDVPRRYGFRMRDVNYIATEMTNGIRCTFWTTYRKDNVSTPSCGSGGPPVAMVYFSYMGESGIC